MMRTWQFTGTCLLALTMACSGDDGGDTSSDAGDATSTGDTSAGSADASSNSQSGSSGSQSTSSDATSSDDTSSGTSDDTSSGNTTTASTGDETTTGKEDTTGADTGPLDDCAGLDQNECYQQQQLGNCVPVWGVPYIEMQNGWCLFQNGTEYLGCAVDEGCADVELTVCAGDESWQTMQSCLPSDAGLAECDPPCNDCPPC